MVDAPWRSPPEALLKTARAMPLKSMPESVQKLWFSAATTASLMESGIWS
jgi:hypothetical protein